VLVVPRLESKNLTCQYLDVPLKPLNLHERVDQIAPEELAALPLSSIQIQGRFSLADAHTWVSNCLQDVPPAGDYQTLFFKSAFVGTCLVLQLRAALIKVQSDNLSVLTIIKVRIRLSV